MLNKKHQETQEGSAVETIVSPLLESLLAVHSAQDVSWLADAVSTAAERGLGALYTFLFLMDSSEKLTAQRPASSERKRHLTKVHQAFGTELSALTLDPGERPAYAAALRDGRATAYDDLAAVLPLTIDPDRVDEAKRSLGVAQAWLAPLAWRGESQGLLLLLLPAKPPATLEQAELLGSHVAVALTNVREEEMGRKQGELDAVRWVHDERRFVEQLAQEIRRAERHDRPLSVVFMRVVNLAELYERYGRFLGERVLRQVAGRLTDAMRDTDFLGAYHEDGFATILVEAEQEGAEIARGRLLASLETVTLPHTDMQDLSVQIACATATMPEDGATAEELVATAERRLLEAAASGEAAA
ncbi:MAG: diguanylate cyclase [Dehalococcoidia bacterium]